MNARQTVLISMLLAVTIFVVATIDLANVQTNIQNRKQQP